MGCGSSTNTAGGPETTSATRNVLPKPTTNRSQNDASYKAVENGTLAEMPKEICKGNFIAATSVGRKAVRLFVSSTFTDTQVERNYLMEKVFPEIRTFCQCRGLSFSVVDLRWGIRDEVTNDHMTSEICMMEIDRCHEASINAPCFLFLSFNKYGYEPLPRTVHKDEFESLLNGIYDTETKEIITKWYKCDFNAVPARYTLQPISTYLPEFLTNTEAKTKWWQEEELIKHALKLSAMSCRSLTETQKLKWNVSVTDNEVRKGILTRASSRSRSIVLLRDIPEIQELDPNDIDVQIACNFIDMSDQAVDPICMKKRSRLREEVYEKCSHVFQYKVSWNKTEGVSRDESKNYLQEMASDFENTMKKGIEEALTSQPALDGVATEAATHLTFCAKRALAFHGRTNLLEQASHYLKNPEKPERTPLVIHGISGAGKTSVVAALAYSAMGILQKKNLDPVLIVRFCGTTPHTSNGVKLLHSICRQISVNYDEDGSVDIPLDYKELKTEFKQQLSKATPEMPLLVFIDSLDQLTDQDRARSELAWLPVTLPPHVYLVVSTLPNIGGSFKTLKNRKIPAENVIEVEPLTPSDAEDIMVGWLKEAGRTLQSEQLSAILKVATDESAEPATALRLRLIFDVASSVTSYSEVPTLPNTVRALINVIFDHLEQYHGKMLVSHVCGYISAAKDGLSESEITDILSGDDKVLDTIFQYHQPPCRKLPFVVFARLRSDLKDYIVERGANEKSVMTWYHRQFWEAAEMRYLKSDPEIHKSYCRMIAQYYSGDLSQNFPERGILQQPFYWQDHNGEIQMNISKLVELPYALIKAEMWEELENTLCDLVFIAAKCFVGLGRDLVQDFAMAINCFDLEFTKLHEVYPFVSSQMHILAKQPQMVIQLALNQPETKLIYKRARDLITSGMPAWMKTANDGTIPIITHINRNQIDEPCKLTLDDHTATVTDIKIVDQMIISSSLDGTLILWDRITGGVMLQLDCSVKIHAFVHTSPNKDFHVIYAGGDNGKIYCWQIDMGGDITADLVAVIEGHAVHPVRAMAVSPNGKLLSIGTCRDNEDDEGCEGIVKILDVTSMSLGETPESSTINFLAEKHEKTFNKDGKRDWKLGIRSLAYSPDSVYLVVGFGHASYTSGAAHQMFAVCDAKSLNVLYINGEQEYQTWCLTFSPCTPTYDFVRLCVSTPYTMSVYKLITGTDTVNFEQLWKKRIDCDHHGAAFSPDGKILISGHGEKLLLWDASNGVQLLTIQGHGANITATTYSANGLYCCTASADHTIKIWEFATTEDGFSYHPPESHPFGCYALGVFPDSKHIVTGGGRGSSEFAEISVWNVETGKRTGASQGFQDDITSLAISPDSSLMAFRTTDGPEICFWNTDQLYMAKIPTKTSKTATLPGESNGHLRTCGATDSLDFSPDGKYLVAPAPSLPHVCYIRVGDMKTFIIDGHEGDLRGGRHSSDGKHLLTWSVAYTARHRKGYDDHPKKTSSQIILWAINMDDEIPLKQLSSVTADDNDCEGDLSRWIPQIGFAYARFHPADKYIVSCTSDAHVHIRNADDLIILKRWKAHHNGTISGLEFSTDGSYIITCANDKWLKIWFNSTAELAASFYVGTLVTCLRIIASDEDKAAKKLSIACGDSAGRMNLLYAENLQSL